VTDRDARLSSRAMSSAILRRVSCDAFAAASARAPAVVCASARAFASSGVPKDFKVPPPPVTANAAGTGGRSSSRYASSRRDWFVVPHRARSDARERALCARFGSIVRSFREVCAFVVVVFSLSLMRGVA
jgi:hypothetical protein